jgi:hypothetical protein
MKQSAILTILVCTTLLGAGVALFLFLLPPKTAAPLPPPQTAQAQTERITSYLLIRKIEELKDRAVYLQHREEGKRLLELAGVQEEKPKENGGTGEEAVVE